MSTRVASSVRVTAYRSPPILASSSAARYTDAVRRGPIPLAAASSSVAPRCGDRFHPGQSPSVLLAYHGVAHDQKAQYGEGDHLHDDVAREEDAVVQGDAGLGRERQDADRPGQPGTGEGCGDRRRDHQQRAQVDVGRGNDVDDRDHHDQQDGHRQQHMLRRPRAEAGKAIPDPHMFHSAPPQDSLRAQPRNSRQRAGRTAQRVPHAPDRTSRTHPAPASARVGKAAARLPTACDQGLTLPVRRRPPRWPPGRIRSATTSVATPEVGSVEEEGIRQGGRGVHAQEGVKYS